ncbi:hypothetical protein V8G54_011685 [Vigna mungo]|uniref:Uncharacterized protein n=1 Tax=Vigna mungo TaxID=3915 RepID=A0AAQ3S3A1_VIGMU
MVVQNEIMEVGEEFCFLYLLILFWASYFLLASLPFFLWGCSSTSPIPSSTSPTFCFVFFFYKNIFFLFTFLTFLLFCFFTFFFYFFYPRWILFCRSMISLQFKLSR